jgi:hypothetical protein
MSQVDDFIAALIHVGADLRAPVPKHYLSELEFGGGVLLPEAVRALYERADGVNGEFGEGAWVFSPITSKDIALSDYFTKQRRYVVEGRPINPRRYLRFFDVLIDAPLYAYCADTESKFYGEVIGIYADGGNFDAFVAAESVTQFLSRLAGSGFNSPIFESDT